MRDYLKKKGVIMALICLFLVIVGLFGLFAPGRVNFIQNGVHGITRPIEVGISNFVTTLERMYNHMFHYDELEARYEALRNRISSYEQLAREAQEITEENERLRELLNLPVGSENLQYIDATLLSWDASNWTHAFTIDRGADFGIAVGDPVMTERREFVGVVREVGGNWATVQTVLDPAVRVGGQLGFGTPAVVEGNFALKQEGFLRLSHVPSGEIPLLNEIITTSGLGGVIPSGLVVGRVERVGMEGTGASHYAVLEPAANFARLVQVFVIQNVPSYDATAEMEDEETP